MLLRALIILCIQGMLFSQSSADINRLKKEAKKLGVTDSQINEAIRSQSQNNNLNLNQINKNEAVDASFKNKSDVENIKIKIDELNEKNVSVNSGNNQFSSGQDSFEDSKKIIDESNEDFPPIVDKRSGITNIKGELKHFGYNIFFNNPELFQDSQDLFVDPSHVIGPGDEIIIMLWGDIEINSPYVVSKDGYVFIENIGQVFVNGLTLSRLEKKLFNLLKKVYSTLDSSSGNATTYLDVSLGTLTLRPIRIHAVGEINNPGAYNLKQSSTLFTSLFYFKGPSEIGTMRKIKLIRKGSVKATIDFYDYLINGQRKNDIKIMTDDVVFIGPKGPVVSAFGEINRPAKYELKPNESLKDLIKMAGGLKSSTYTKRVKINRIVPGPDRDVINADRVIIDISIDDITSSDESFKLVDGDELEFFKISDLVQNTVNISGEVLRPGAYELDKEMRISSLIKKAGGLTKFAYKKRADVFRSDVDLIETLVTVDIDDALNGNDSEDIYLNEGDLVKIYSTASMKYITDVRIEGHVLSPGSKPFRNNMKVEDLVFLGGGFENDNHLLNTYLSRATLSSINTIDLTRDITYFNLDSVLSGNGIAKKSIKMGDIIRIYSISEILGDRDQTVSISGHVKFPGKYPLYNGLTLSKIISLAGDYEDKEFLKDLFVDRADIVRRIDGTNDKEIITFNLKNYVTNGIEKDMILKNGDEIRIYKSNFFDDKKEVNIQGSINSPGSYELKENMTLFDLIIEAGGIPVDVYSSRVEIASTNRRKSFEDNYVNIKSFDLLNDKRIYSGQSDIKDNFILKPYDAVTIRPSPLFSAAKQVSVLGYVYYPGNYTILSSKDKLSDLIRRAGGLTPEAYPRGSRFIRNSEEIKINFEKILNSPRVKDNFFVMEGDSIIIGSKPNLVKVVGAVNSPGNYQYKKALRMNDYIELAGGFTTDARRGGTFVQHADGSSLKRNLFKFSPRVYDGSTITVPTKEEVEPFSLTEYVTNLTAIWADITQALLIISALR